MLRRQSSGTIKQSVTVEGIGIHTGTPSRITLLPAPSGAGIVFRSRGVEIPARAASVVDTSRCTVLGKDGVTISTVEHLMSAIASQRYDKRDLTNLYIDVEGVELPIGDGSANLWVETLAGAGLHKIGTQKRLAPEGDLLITGKNGSFITAFDAQFFSATVVVQFDHPLIGTQVAHFQAFPGNYAESIAPARTFGFIEEVEALRKAGLALGGNEDNAVVIYPDRYSRPLRFENELARHKLLDLIGDLALAGLPFANMQIFAYKPSHGLNVEFAKKLAANDWDRENWYPFSG
ncbi:MAG: UDP-3-O-[3-hydroxymyristoyl] N-acetylglucosamine deacetylase [Akkermansiaceae bacterium]|nr:UDP-3-O-[3-hydroxymyristoyl] N-acetylglucosamine deacetylase [Armatimonadota bacterium]